MYTMVCFRSIVIARDKLNEINEPLHNEGFTQENPFFGKQMCNQGVKFFMS